MVTLIDVLAIAGVGLILPLALGADLRPWVITAALAAISFGPSPGPAAAALVVPLVGLAAAHLLGAVVTDPVAVRTIACVYAVVSTVWLAASRAGIEPVGVEEPIVELTAVHFAYAGAAATVLASTWGSPLAVVLTAVAPPVVATGFLTGAGVLQVGGAVLMTAGTYLTAFAEVRIGTSPRYAIATRLLLIVSGVAVVVPMVLAVAWAAGQHLGTPALSIPDMARTHGVANAVGFTLCGLLGIRYRARAGVTS